jgi:LysM repeat protein
MWTKSACVVLAWSILIILVAVAMKGSARPAQANIRIASSTTHVTLTSTLSTSAVAVTAPSPTVRYLVQSGDTLAGIAAALAVPGGWPALYAANTRAIGPNPNLIHSGTVLVLPGRMMPVRYTVGAGDTLSGIAAALGIHGGWPALYAANRGVVGSNPNVIRAGIVLTLPPLTRRSATAPHAPTQGRWLPTASPPARAVSPYRRLSPPTAVPAPAPVATGMPRWLTTMLVVAGLLIALAFLTEAVAAAGRRRRQAASWLARLNSRRAGQGPDTGSAPFAKKEQSRIVLAEYDRLVVTHSKGDNTVYVLRPPGEDAEAIMRVARLVLPEYAYRELARELGLPVSWPFVLADYDRLIVTCRTGGDAVYVLRPPGEDPRAIMRAARLVLHEDPYEELAEQLGVSASWPMGLRCSRKRAGVVAPARPGPRQWSSGSGAALVRSDSTSAATCRRSSGVSSSMLAMRSSLSGSPGRSCPAAAAS